MYRHRTSSDAAGVIAPSTDLISHVKNVGNGQYRHDRMAPAGSRLQGPAVLAQRSTVRERAGFVPARTAMQTIGLCSTASTAILYMQ
jgi:hypothetical protein